MKFSSTLIVLAAAVVGTATADGVASSTSSSPWMQLLQKLIDGRVRSPVSAKYTWVPMNATAPVAVGGPPVTLYGDAKSINAQILKMNPNYKVDNFVDKSAVTPPGQPATAIVPPLCNNWPQGGSINLLEEGIVDLNSSVVSIDVPIKSCVALTCIDSASIGLCNDNAEPITKISKDLVVYLEILVNYCLSSSGTVNGQVFDKGDFNLVFDSGHCTPPSKGSNYQSPASPTSENQTDSNNPGSSPDTSGGATTGNQLDPNDPGAPVQGPDTSGGATTGNQPDPNDPGAPVQGPDTSGGATTGNSPDPNDPGAPVRQP